MASRTALWRWALVAVAALGFAPLLRAATITVNSTADCDTAGCDGGNTTLRMAIESVNAGSNQADAVADVTNAYGTSDTIQFSYGSYPQTITLSGSSLTISASVTINGSSTGPIVIDANAGSDVVSVSAGTVSLNYLTLTGGSAIQGGGLYVNGSTTVNMSNGTVNGNVATGAGAIPSVGGGIFIQVGTLNLFNSTVANNTADSVFSGGCGPDGCNEPGVGGGIYVNLGTLNVVSSTISGNVAQDGDFSSGLGAGLATSGPTSTASLQNTLVASNTNGSGTSNCGGAVTDSGYNMSDDGTCSFSGTGSANNVGNLNLDTLKDNGGPTKTIALLSGSAAIDQIGSGTSGCGTTVASDQRGVSRPQNGKCDIGAFEVCPPPTVTCPAPTSASADSTCQAEIPDVLSGVTTSDNCLTSNTPALQQDPTAGTLVGLGPHTITVTATDSTGQTNTCQTTFTVNDTTPPVVTSSVSVAVLANDHTMRNVGYAESASDNCGGDLTNSAVIEIYSSEQEQAPTTTGGDGTTSPDARGRGTCLSGGIWTNKIGLRQERLNNGPGRIYLIKTSATDPSNNTGWSCATVVSPRSSKKADLNKVLAAATAVKSVCNQFGAIPSNYYPIGSCTVIGSKQ